MSRAQVLLSGVLFDVESPSRFVCAWEPRVAITFLGQSWRLQVGDRRERNYPTRDLAAAGFSKAVNTAMQKGTYR